MKKMIIDLLKYGPVLIFIAFGSRVFASEKPIVCNTHRGAKVFEIVGNRVSINLDSEAASQRFPASNFQNARHKVNAKGLTKIVFFEGQKHTVHIEDLNNLSALDDYVVISSKKGHQITYPLNCALTASR